MIFVRRKQIDWQNGIKCWSRLDTRINLQKRYVDEDQIELKDQKKDRKDKKGYNIVMMTPKHIHVHLFFS